MRRSRALLGAVCAAATLYISAPAQAADACDTLLPGQQGVAFHGPLTEDLLARMRDAGPIYTYQADRPILALSPDRNSVAFEIHQANPSDDSYCVGIVIVPLRKGAKPELVDISHELILDPHPAKGWAAFESGVSLPITPRWSPDGRWLAFLKRVGGSTQVWRADLGRDASEQLSKSPADVDDFRIGSDGRSVIYASRPDLAANNAAIDRESLTGWRVDARTFPSRGLRPMTPNAATRYLSVDIATGIERPATSEEIDLFARPAEISKAALTYAQGPGRSLAWLEPTDQAAYPPSLDLTALTTKGKRIICEARLCRPDQLSRLWWSDDGQRLWYSRREGWAGSETGIYEWRPGKGAPKRVFATRDALAECQTRGDDLLCFRDSSTKPRWLVELGLGRKSDRVFFETNPEFAGLTLGRVERKEWRSGLGIPFYADLVYPLGYTRGQRYPMVVVQYRTRGFLRGGVGDEMPIQAFASRGYFALVFDIGDEAAFVGPQSSALEQQRALNRNLIGPEHVLSGLETIIRSLIDDGLVDAKRIGIHGLSAGSTTVQFAAINSGLFSAGSLSGCCWEPDQDTFLGPTLSNVYHQQGWPRLIDPHSEFWSRLSIMQAPARVRFPLLLQVADKEAFAALGSFTALTQAGVPADLFVFPDEYHLKWHPVHRLAVYRRNLAWFDFWLKGDLPDDPALRSAAMRWSDMRGAWHTPAP